MSLIEEALRRQERDGRRPAPPVVRPLDPPPPPRRPPEPPPGAASPATPANPAATPSRVGPRIGLAALLVLAVLVLGFSFHFLARLPRAQPRPGYPPASSAALKAEPAPGPATHPPPLPAPRSPLPDSPLLTNTPTLTAAPPPPPPWPRFVLKGYATGAPGLAMLDTGEMLGEGERSRTGVRVVRVVPEGVRFAWHAQTNLLRKGESSDKPLP